MEPTIHIQHIWQDVFVLHNFWSKQRCEDFMASIQTKNFEKATINTGMGARVVDHIRNNERLMYKDHDLVQELWDRLQPYAVQQYGESTACGLNEMIRVYKYGVGQVFKRHRDESYRRSRHEASFFTFMIYLNDGYEGGETSFQKAEVVPTQGSALIFPHHLLHEGNEVTAGEKLVLRTDIMYRMNEENN
jgi:predicted 2-oxoglutarate/Fe(II)-dependent dioxygenase YbiX